MAEGASPKYLAPSVPVAVRESDGAEYLALSSLRSKLTPRDSPFKGSNFFGGGFVDDGDLVGITILSPNSQASSGAAHANGMYDAATDTTVPLPPFAVRSGPRATVYRDPSKVTAAVLTCGGLCPGLNDVVENVVHMLDKYGVPSDQVYGIRYGLRGFIDPHLKPVPLDAESVRNIHLKGGTVLGTSRGYARIPEIVDRIALWGINMLFVVGGNGGNAAAHAIAKECLKRGVDCSVVGVPKSIDNDIQLVDRCFGFDTSVEEAARSLLCAHVEARSSGGIAVVKLMGRQSGYIALHATLASGVVDVCLIPEIPFHPDKLMAHVKSILAKQDHCVICVAEGAIIKAEVGKGIDVPTDASGNPILDDIGPILRDYVKAHLPGIDCRYIDPSYMIRSIPTITTDRIYCKALGHSAVHAAFAGYTDVTVGLVNTHSVLLPTETVLVSARMVDPKGRLWTRAKSDLGQPDLN